MRALNYAFNSSEHGERECSFNIVVAIYRWSYWIVNLIIQSLILSQVFQLLLLRFLDVEFIHVQQFGDAVGFDQSRKQGETLLHIQRTFIAVYVNSNYFNVISWPCEVNVIAKQDNFLAARNTTRQHITGGLLQCDFLVVAVDSLLLVQREGSCRMTRLAFAQGYIVYVVDIEGAFWITTFNAFVHDLLQLVENLASNCNDTLN